MVMLGLLSPIADPARIAVADQEARLESGRISPDEFDFAFLRFRSGRYGLQALDRLRMERGGPNAAHIAELANAAFASNTPFYGWPPIQRVPPVQRVEPPTPIDLAAKITVVYPKGQSLPESFLQQDWSAAPDRWRY